MKIKRLTIKYERVDFFAVFPILATSTEKGEGLVVGWGRWMWGFGWERRKNVAVQE